MSRLSDLPEPYAVVVMLPGTPGHPPITQQVNGRVARMIAWLLDQRERIETGLAGSVLLNFGDRGVQAILTLTSAYINVSPSSGPWTTEPPPNAIAVDYFPAKPPKSP